MAMWLPYWGSGSRFPNERTCWTPGLSPTLPNSVKLPFRGEGEEEDHYPCIPALGQSECHRIRKKRRLDGAGLMETVVAGSNTVCFAPMILKCLTFSLR